MKKQILCKSCGCIFTLTKNQIRFYEEKGWQIPKNCVFCRKINRQERSDPYYGLEEAVANYIPLKRRRQRVHYKPYIVGGMR